MAWTAQLTMVEKDGANVVPTVVFSNSATGETITEKPRAVDITADRLKAWAQNRLDQLTTRDATFATLTVGAVAKPPAKTQAEADADAWFATLHELNALKMAIDKGIIDATAPAYVSRLASVRAGFKVAYLTDHRFR